MPNFGFGSLTHYRTPITTNTVTTSDSSYSAGLVPIIQVWSLDKEETLYNFNGFFPDSMTTNPVIYCNVGLSLSHHGTFEMQIDDSDKTLSASIRNGKRVLIYFGKTLDTVQLMMSGMIRETGYTRGCEQNLLFNLSGFGTGIRFNERILDITLNPPVLDDGVTIDLSDHEFHANRVVDDSLDRALYYPKAGSEVEGTGGYGYIDSSDTEITSPIEDTIPGVNLRFNEIEDLHQQIESYTGGRIYADVYDKVQFQPITSPVTANSGFLITTNPQFDLDLADYTMYVQTDEYTYSSSISKDAGYTNSLYGILSASPVPDVDTNSNFSNFFENKTVEIAQRFKPITNPNWRMFTTIEAVGMDNTAVEGNVKGRVRVCQDDNGVPKNGGGIVGNKYVLPNDHYNTGDGGIQTVHTMGLGSVDLDENSFYWFIWSSVNSTPTVYWRWYYDNAPDIPATVATASPGTSSATDGGSGWTLRHDIKMGMIQTRFKAEPYNILDHKGVFTNILIESVVPSFPQQITSKMAATKYLAGLIGYQARPRNVYNFSALTIPNKTPLPGDVCAIVDSRFNFSTSGHAVVAGQITDLNYSVGIKNGGSSPSSKGMTDLSMSVIGYPDNY